MWTAKGAFEGLVAGGVGAQMPCGPSSDGRPESGRQSGIFNSQAGEITTMFPDAISGYTT